jgi:hypothetical protein
MLAKSLAGQIASAEFWTAVSWKENFSGGGAMHLRGKSVSIFDVRVGKWKQTWVDNEGGYLDFGGESKHGQMILSREATRPVAPSRCNAWSNITHDEFDWTF